MGRDKCSKLGAIEGVKESPPPLPQFVPRIQPICHTFFWLPLCLWFRATLICGNNFPTSCNTKRSIHYSASSLYLFRVSATPIIRSTQNCNYRLRYWSYFLCSYLPPTWTSLTTLGGGSCTKHVEWACRIINRLICVASRWTVINIVFDHIPPFIAVLP